MSRIKDVYVKKVPGNRATGRQTEWKDGKAEIYIACIAIHKGWTAYYLLLLLILLKLVRSTFSVYVSAYNISNDYYT